MTSKAPPLFKIVLYHAFTVVVGTAATRYYSGDKVVRVVPKAEIQVHQLRNLRFSKEFKVDFWKTPGRPGAPVDIHVKSRDFMRLSTWMTREGLTFTLLSRDVQQLIDHELDSGKYADEVQDWFGHYHSYEEINNELEELSSTFPERASVQSIGVSYEDREQMVIRINGKPKANKPVFFVNCGIHAREWIASATCMYIIHELVTKYGQDSDVTSTLDKMDFIIHPLVNPDGYEFTRTTERLWRKNLNGTGVDLNRNFGFHWGEKGGSSASPMFEDYRGSAPFSEPETRNIKVYLENLGDVLQGTLDVHSYGQYILLPWGYTRDPTNDHEELVRAAKSMGHAIYSAGRRTTYKIGGSAKMLYKVSGSTQDYAYGSLGVKYPFVIELPPNSGKPGFMLPEHDIVATAKETLIGLIALVREMNV